MPSESNNRLPPDLPPSKKPRSLTTLALFGGSTLAVLYLLVLGISYFIPIPFIYNPFGPVHPAVLPHDSPVEIAGGSIHICSRTFRIPSSGNRHDWDIAALPPGDINVVGTENVTNFPNFPNLQSTTIVGDWAIHITDGVSDDAVTLISNNGHLLIHTRDAINSLSSDRQAIILPPDDGVCSNAANCASLRRVTLFTNGGHTHTTGDCVGGKCGIYIGVPGAKGAYTCERAHM